jgi:succinate dehydrogenase / fumarate reductase cytochrome b subunit
MPTPQRPLSPHLQIYKRQITSVLSILHRITGIFLAFGAFGLALILLEASRNPWGSESAHSSDVFSMVYQGLGFVFDSWVGLVLILVFLWSLIYHLLNGIRHLFWDAGKGFDIKQFTASGWVVVVLSFLISAGLIAMPMLGCTP